MTSEHRAEMALKRGKPAVPNQGWYSVYCADVNLCCLLVEQVLPPIQLLFSLWIACLHSDVLKVCSNSISS